MDEYITDIKEISSKKALVYINDAPSFALYKNEADKLEIRKGYILKPEKKEELFSQILYERALNRALALIRAKDYSTFEIRQKLYRDHYPDDKGKQKQMRRNMQWLRHILTMKSGVKPWKRSENTKEKLMTIIKYSPFLVLSPFFSRKWLFRPFS